MNENKISWGEIMIIFGIVLLLILILLIYFVLFLMEDENINKENLELIKEIDDFYNIYFHCDEADNYIIGFNSNNKTIKLNDKELCDLVFSNFKNETN